MADELLKVDSLEEEIAGLDALDALDEQLTDGKGNRLGKAWAAAWPKVAAIGLFLLVWQIVAWAGWKTAVIRDPATALGELVDIVTSSRFTEALTTTSTRALVGYGLATAIGTFIGASMWRSSFLRRAFGSFLTGLQSMPSIVWFPLTIALFGFTEWAIISVVILGAAPSIGNGLLNGVDHIPPLLTRAGRILGARGFAAFRYVVLPAALPSYVAGLKQAWAFAWRSLMAGELIVTMGRASLGGDLNFARELADYPRLLAMMIVIFAISVLVDSLFFNVIERRIRRKRGLVEVGAAA
jgi:NitT/TauT family transport system permease protein